MKTIRIAILSQPFFAATCNTAGISGARLALKPLCKTSRRHHCVAFSISSSGDDLVTVETLPTGRAIKKLVSDVGLRPSRTVDDLPEDLVEELVKKYVSVKTVVKLGRRGVTEKVAADVQKRWNNSECVKVVADHPKVKADMKDTADEVARLTGGIVVWRAGFKLLVYRDNFKKDSTSPEAKTDSDRNE